MEESDKIEIRVIGRMGNDPLSPENFDIREIKSLFDVVETLLYPNQKNSRAPVTYSLETGSVRNIFRTTRQSAAAFIAIVSFGSPIWFSGRFGIANGKGFSGNSEIRYKK